MFTLDTIICDMTQVLKSQLFVDTFSESVQHTFLDYLAGGCELNFMVAIDFTGNECYTCNIQLLLSFTSYYCLRNVTPI